MGKGKGRQAGDFGSKAMKAQFQKEWMGNFNDEMTGRRKKQQRLKTSASRFNNDNNAKTQRPRLLLNSLRSLLDSRQRDDHREYTRNREKMRGNLAKKLLLSQPGSTLFLQDDEYCRELRERKHPTLQMLAMEAFAPVLPDYLEQLGFEALHQYISYLSGPTISQLSVLISQSSGMTDAVLQLLGTHTQVTRLSIQPPKIDDESDGSWTALTSEGFRRLIPSWGHQSSVPDHWEEDSHEFEWKGCIRLQRLELIALPHLAADALLDLLAVCRSITHLSLSGSLEFSSGPEIIWKLPEVLCNLKFLDVSDNDWVTENLMRNLLDRFNSDRPQLLKIKVHGCFTPTEAMSIQMDYHDQIDISDMKTWSK